MRGGGIDAFYAVQHEKCNEQICKKLNLKRPDGTNETIEIENMSIKEDDIIPIICDICYSIQRLHYKVYKERTVDANNTFLACNECFVQLKQKETKKCNSPNCNNTFQYTPYYYEKLGYPSPTKCKLCRGLVEEICEYQYCSQKTELMYHEWKEVTDDGKLPFICKRHDGEMIEKECQNCLQNKPIELKYFCQNFTVRRYMCKDCFAQHKKEKIKCSTPKCNVKRSFISLFNSSPTFNRDKDNKRFTCI